MVLGRLFSSARRRDRPSVGIDTLDPTLTVAIGMPLWKLIVPPFLVFQKTDYTFNYTRNA
jgi:hypothetical protein